MENYSANFLKNDSTSSSDFLENTSTNSTVFFEYHFKDPSFQGFIKTLEKNYVLPKINELGKDTEATFFAEFRELLSPKLSVSFRLIHEKCPVKTFMQSFSSQKKTGFFFNENQDLVIETTLKLHPVSKKGANPLSSQLNSNPKFHTEVVYSLSQTPLKGKWDDNLSWMRGHSDTKYHIRQFSSLYAFLLGLSLLEQQILLLTQMPQKEREDAVFYHVLSENPYGQLLLSGSSLFDLLSFSSIGKRTTNLFTSPKGLTPDFLDFLDVICVTLLTGIADEMEQRKYLQSSTSDYAKVFMTKKNISKKTKEAMESSVLNQVFKYVEYDNSVDFFMMECFSKDFVALIQHFLGEETLFVNESLRVRLLGQHKALGIYYPTVHCLCVDPSSPESACHELGHLLDYYGTNEKKSHSMGYRFKPVRDCYTEAFLSEVRKKNSSFHNRGKYNLRYYLRPTEIFARCFEIYVVRLCEFQNSAVKAEPLGFAYPENNELYTLIEEYFDCYLDQFHYKI